MQLLAAMPLVALAYVQIVQPVADRLAPGALSTQIAWPALFMVTVLLIAISWRRIDTSRLATLPSILLFAFLAFAGLSVLWAYSQPDTVVRWVLAVMVVVVVFVPLAVATPKFDTLDAMLWCVTIAIAINVIFVLTTPPMKEWTGLDLGHPGYFPHKQYLGMCASLAILGAVYWIIIGKFRLVGFALLASAIWIIFESRSKTSLGFLLAAPVAALIVFGAAAWSNRPLVIFAVAVPLAFIVLSMLVTNLTSRIAFNLYGDPTFTGRIFIWEFIENQAALRPWLGWGFHSFWYVPNSPVNWAPGFIRDMPSAHSGYLDMRLETGYVGLSIFLSFLVALLYQLENVRRTDPSRAFMLLSLFSYVLVMNLMETLWFIPFDPLWIVFLTIAGETIRRPVLAASTSRQDTARAVRRNRFAQPRTGASALRSLH